MEKKQRKKMMRRGVPREVQKEYKASGTVKHAAARIKGSMH